jgi:DNA replication and repair protein RecF
MILKQLNLQNFRNYTKAEFDFSSLTTIVIGPNAYGKSNLIEAVNLLSTGKSSRSDKDIQLIQFGKNICRVKGVTENAGPVSLLPRPTASLSLQALDGGLPPLATRTPETSELEVVFAQSPTQFLQKKYLVNGVSKRRLDFTTNFPSVLFTPVDLDIVAGQPGVRRKFLDEVLEQIDQEYAISHSSYIKALRQRNALLELVQETGKRDEEQFLYWDNLLIKNGQSLTKKRQDFIEYINNRKKELFDFVLEYDSSVISQERLLKYKNAEIGSGTTLVGPHRDEMLIRAQNKLSKNSEEVRFFGSRGQQRLVSLELKLSQIEIIKERTDKQPILLLDDVFSELDSGNINLVLDLMNTYQTIATTTHKEFVNRTSLKNVKMIELDK